MSQKRKEKLMPRGYVHTYIGACAHSCVHGHTVKFCCCRCQLDLLLVFLSSWHHCCAAPLLSTPNPRPPTPLPDLPG